MAGTEGNEEEFFLDASWKDLDNKIKFLCELKDSGHPDEALNDLYIVYELYTFDHLFRLLLKSDFDHEEALSYCQCLTQCLCLSGKNPQQEIQETHC